MEGPQSSADAQSEAPEVETRKLDDSEKQKRPARKQSRARKQSASRASQKSSASKKPSAATTRTRKPSKAEQAKTWLLEAEAKYITYALTAFFASRYGLRVMPPEPEKVKHLAGVLRKLEAFPPVALLQKLLARVIPMADPEAKPGGSLAGDLAQYLHGWHERNPGLAMVIYANEPLPELPFFPKAPAVNRPAPAQAGDGSMRVVKIGRPLTSEEYREAKSE